MGRIGRGEFVRRFLSLLAISSIFCMESPSVIARSRSRTRRSTPIIVLSRNPSALERLAGQELRRAIYLRTSQLSTIAHRTGSGPVISLQVDPSLEEQEYHLIRNGKREFIIRGGSPLSVLYASYRFAELLGIRFYLHGDVIPDEKISFKLPDVHLEERPLFATRGIQPFHDFPEGPDWWNEEDYLHHITQLVKMRMNFIGFHCYPEGGVGPEPLVWIGLAEDVGSDAEVSNSYPSRWASTKRSLSWGYQAMDPATFSAGASLLFPAGAYGPDVMKDMLPEPKTPEQCNELFRRVGEMLSRSFEHAHALGVQTCIGTETPLTIPKAVRDRLEALGMDPKEEKVVQKIYEGMFRRIQRTHPLDTYWLWTPEHWTWRGANKNEIGATVRDIQAALKALDALGNPFHLATCGWVLGPPGDRALFDPFLPKDAAMACINRQVGFTPVEPGFSDIRGRPAWAIPWLEDDPAMIIPQLWAGRMRRDAADALAYGCTGLLGIHWRTWVLSPNLSTLAQASWDQSAWNEDLGRPLAVPTPVRQEGRLNGIEVAFNDHLIQDTEEDPVYRTVVYDVDGYRLELPNGSYQVTLGFCEPHYRESGRRVFGVQLEGATVLRGLDIFQRVGQDRALDLTFSDVRVQDGLLDVDFLREVEYPCIAAIHIEGQSFSKKINCGGKAYNDYREDLPRMDTGRYPNKPRDLPVQDFYDDWASAQFGPNQGKALADLFVSLDGGGTRDGKGRISHLPRPSDWMNGPGGIPAQRRPWEKEKERYGFVEEMASLRSEVHGKGALARFDAWLNVFRYLKTVGKLGCLRGKLDEVIEQIENEKEEVQKKALAKEEALPVRLELARTWEEAMTLFLQTVSTQGDLGTVANLEQHVRGKLKLLSAHDEKLAGFLEGGLPEDAQPRHAYVGRPRLLVPTARTQAEDGKAIEIHGIFLAGHGSPPSETATKAELLWRPLGQGSFRKLPIANLRPGRWKAMLPLHGKDLEYYVRISWQGEEILWPETAPDINQTVILWER